MSGSQADRMNVAAMIMYHRSSNQQSGTGLAIDLGRTGDCADRDCLRFARSRVWNLMGRPVPLDGAGRVRLTLDGFGSSNRMHVAPRQFPSNVSPSG